MHKQVVIVGAGVIGCLLGKILKNNSIPFKILERSPQYQKKGDRTVALTKQSIILLNKLFPDIDINKYSTPVSKMSLFHESKKNLILKSDEIDKVTSICLLDWLNKNLIDELKDYIVWNNEIQKIDFKKNKIELTGTKNIIADVVFATDGSNSKIRELINFEIEKWFYDQKAYTFLVEANHNSEAKQYFLETGTLAFLPINLNKKKYYSVIFCTNTKENPETELKQIFKNFQIKIDTNNISLTNSAELSHSRAKKLFKDGVFLCGDAANSFHPMAGQGLNLGIGDIIEIEKNLKEIIDLEDDAIAAYSNIRTQKNIQMTWIIQSLYAMFSNSRGFMKILLDSGMKFLDSTPKIKNKIIEFANKN